MKRLSEYTNDELINLTKEEYNKLIDFECMNEGVPLSIETPKYKELPSIPEAEILLYQVAGFLFEDETEAKEFLKVVNNLKSCVRTDYECYVGNPNYKYVTERNVRQNNRITEEKAYTEEAYYSIRLTLKNINDLRKYNRNVKAEYKSKWDQRNAIINDINEAIDKAKDEAIRLENAVQVYKKYLELSEGNEIIAQSFFSTTEYANFFPKVLEKITGQEGTING
ncbi:hypothetical protein J4O15_03885 [Lachnoanaerobaculum sp. Marseille-Q4761]|uniref:hypothetical protein n=1 Tax=Lachnoanaerobaculum sp. Marseille-Q4761 TaxID=2819511 RepID=UPI001AA15433|nr:hypothetical protein [Lachnoanaerobaculum sp. Marseille-Q4761]MBO1870099.1 hypothetical protein [Lachnoanaerobaculum sp. Marseille-Q4761]